MDLAACKCGAPATEQVRGEMGPGDYWQDRQEPPVLFPFGNLVPQKDGPPMRVPFCTLVEAEVNDYTRFDRRIACTACQRATGWSKGSFKTIAEAWERKCAA